MVPWGFVFPPMAEVPPIKIRVRDRARVRVSVTYVVFKRVYAHRLREPQMPLIARKASPS